METNNLQPHDEMTPEEAKATLGFSTMLQDQLMPEMAMQEGAMMPSQEPQEAPGGEKTLEIEEDITPEPEEPKIDLKAELEDFKNELRDSIKNELSILRKDIKNALED